MCRQQIFSKRTGRVKLGFPDPQPHSGILSEIAASTADLGISEPIRRMALILSGKFESQPTNLSGMARLRKIYFV